MRAVVGSMVAATVLWASGCTAPNGPVFAPIVIDAYGPVAGFDNNVRSDKVGRAMAKGIIMVGTGDASIERAAANGRITRIHHVDSQSMNILGVYSQYETVVYGE